MLRASSAYLTNSAFSSASEWTATVAMPISRQARITRTAISPRLATSSFLIGFGLPGLRAAIRTHRPVGR